MVKSLCRRIECSESHRLIRRTGRPVTDRSTFRSARHTDRVTLTDAALTALAERGQWDGPPGDDAERMRDEIRQAARKAGIHVRTWIDRRGTVHAMTPDGYPAREPWRGAAIHVIESGAESAAAAAALQKLFGGSER